MDQDDDSCRDRSRSSRLDSEVDGSYLETEDQYGASEKHPFRSHPFHFREAFPFSDDAAESLHFPRDGSEGQDIEIVGDCIRKLSGRLGILDIRLDLVGSVPLEEEVLEESEDKDESEEHQSYGQIFPSYYDDDERQEDDHPQDIEDEIVYHIFIRECQLIYLLDERSGKIVGEKPIRMPVDICETLLEYPPHDLRFQ